MTKRYASAGTRRRGDHTTWKISVPEQLAVRAEFLLMDATYAKPIYGIRSQLICDLLEQWITAKEKEILASHNATPSSQAAQ